MLLSIFTKTQVSIMSVPVSFEINTGASIPAVGLGQYRLSSFLPQLTYL